MTPKSSCSHVTVGNGEVKEKITTSLEHNSLQCPLLLFTCIFGDFYI